MKTFVVLLPLLLTAPARSAENPPAPCSGFSCTPRILEIARGFQGATAPSAAGLPLLASGECFHLNSNYSPETTHYGAVFLDPRDGKLFMSGAFGFFFPENPYRQWTAEQVRRENPDLYSENHRVELTPDFAFSDMNPGKTPIWWYWVKSRGSKVYVMGHWGVFHRLLCELDTHP